MFNTVGIHLQNKEIQEALATWIQVYRIAKQIGLAKALNVLDNLAKEQGGLEFWEQLAQQFEA